MHLSKDFVSAIKEQKKQVFQNFVKDLSEEKQVSYSDQAEGCYTTISLTHLLDTTLSDFDKVLLMLLRAYSAKEGIGAGYCYPTEKTMALQLGVSDRTVRRGLSNLLKKGIIEKIGSSDYKFGNVYAISNAASGDYAAIPSEFREQKSFYLGTPQDNKYHFHHVRGKDRKFIEEYFSEFKKKINDIENNAIFNVPLVYNGKKISEDQYIDILVDSIKAMINSKRGLIKVSKSTKIAADLFMAHCNNFSKKISALCGKMTLHEITYVANQFNIEDIQNLFSTEEGNAVFVDRWTKFVKGGRTALADIIIIRLLSILFENFLKEKDKKENLSEAFGLQSLGETIKILMGVVNRKIMRSSPSEKIRSSSPRGGTGEIPPYKEGGVGEVPPSQEGGMVEGVDPLSNKMADGEMETKKEGCEMDKGEAFKQILEQSMNKTKKAHEERIEKKIKKIDAEHKKNVASAIDCTKQDIASLPMNVFLEQKKGQLDYASQSNHAMPQLAGNCEGMQQTTYTLFMEFKILLKKHFDYETSLKAGPKELGQLKNILRSYDYHAFLELMIKTFEYWSILKEEFFFLKDSEMPTLSTLTMSERMEKIEMLIRKIESGKYERKEKIKKGKKSAKKDDKENKPKKEPKKLPPEKRMPISRATYEKYLAINPDVKWKYRIKDEPMPAE